MATEIKADKRVQCPSCGQKAKQVSPVTLRALLKDEYASQFDGEGHSCCASDGNGDDTGCEPISGDSGWRFCDSQECDVVYFSEEGGTTFTKSQLRVEVGVKETTGERPLCYCFGHSVASIKEELRTTGGSESLEDIRAKMKAPGCRCETENPSGSCCLGNVGKGIKIAQEELGMNDTDIQKPIPSKSSTGKGEKIAKIGTIVSAIMASSCCWLPLVLLAVGVSGAGIASTLEAYRPLFMVVTFGFLGAAFYFTYRPKKVAAGGGHDCCAIEQSEGEDCCVPNAKGRFNMMTLNKAMLWGVTVMAVAFLFFPSYVGAIIGVDGKSVTENMNQSVIKVEGMTCEGCSALVANAIRTAPGVLAVEVDYEKGEAIVGTESCCSIPKDSILSALEKSGYKGAFTASTKTTAVDASQSPACCVVSDKKKALTASLSHGQESLFQAVFEIKGMTCEGCVAGVSESIANVPGVLGVQVDYKSGQAIVKSNDCYSVLNEKVLSAIKTAGFDGKAVNE